MNDSDKDSEFETFVDRHIGELKPMVGRRVTLVLIGRIVSLLRVAYFIGLNHCQGILSDKSQQWQPIDSHPKEGRFIVYSPNNKDMRTLSSDMLGLMEKFGYTYAYWRPLPAPPLLDTVENPEDLSWS